MKDASFPPELTQLLEDFSDIVATDLPSKLPPLRSIKHHIDFTPGVSLPNLPHYKMSPTEHWQLQKIVDDLLQKTAHSAQP